jgi:membrane protein DedA with SNARE-associated domain
LDPLVWIFLFVFVVSFLSNVSPFFGASYTLLATLQLTLIGPSPFNFVVVVLVSAIGATLAKTAIYYGAFELKGIIGKNKNVQLIGRNATKRKFYLALFVTALLPVLPLDDFIYIGAGASAASLSLMAVVTLGAKILKSGFEIAIELTLLKGIGEAFGFNRLDITVALIAVFLVIGILIYQVDWEKTYHRVTSRSKPSAENAALALGQERSVIVSSLGRLVSAGVAQPGQRREA